MGNETFLGLVVEIAQVLAAGFHVLLEVEVAAVGDALQFAPAPGELVLDVAGAAGIMRQLLLVVLAKAEIAAGQAQLLVPVEPLVAPLLVPFLAAVRPAKELD